MKKLYATLAAVALTASSAFAVNFTVDGLKSIEDVSLKDTQLVLPKHAANEVSYLNCIETSKSRVEIPVEFDGNLADYKILIGYSSDDNQVSMPSNITVDGTQVTFNNFLGYRGINMVGEADPEGNITVAAGQELEKDATYKYVLATADTEGKVALTGNMTFTMNKDGNMLSSSDVFAIVAVTVADGKLARIVNVLFEPMVVKPNATVEYSYTAYGDTPTTETVKEDVWYGLSQSGNNNLYFFLSNIVPEFPYNGAVTIFRVYTDAFVAVNPIAVTSFPYTNSGQQYYSGDMMLVNETEMGYSFPMVASLTPSTISNLAELEAVTLKNWAIVNPYESLDLFNSFVGNNVTDAVITIKKDDAGVNNVVADPAKAPAQYFNLQGMQLTNPEAGQVVIVKEGNTAKKVIF